MPPEVMLTKLVLQLPAGGTTVAVHWQTDPAEMLIVPVPPVESKL
jgi:hypothetical protein